MFNMLMKSGSLPMCNFQTNGVTKGTSKLDKHRTCVWYLFDMLFYVLMDIELISKETTLQWRHNECDGVSNHQPHDCLFNRLFRHRSKKSSKLRVTGLCAGNSPVTGEFPAQMASNAENDSIWWRHHEIHPIGNSIHCRNHLYISLFAALVFGD